MIATFPIDPIVSGYNIKQYHIFKIKNISKCKLKTQIISLFPDRIIFKSVLHACLLMFIFLGSDCMVWHRAAEPALNDLFDVLEAGQVHCYSILPRLIGSRMFQTRENVAIDVFSCCADDLLQSIFCFEVIKCTYLDLGLNPADFGVLLILKVFGYLKTHLSNL